MKYVSALALASLCSTTWAATLVESTNPMGKTQQVWLEGNQVRFEGGMPGSYMLMNLADEKMYAVNAEQKQIIDLSNKPEAPQGLPPGFPPGQQPPQQAPVDAKLEKKGDGPEIAGFATTHYQITANGNVCSDEYLSADALKLPEIQTFMQAMQKNSPKKHGRMPFMQMEPCMQASMDISEQFETLGMPMRTVSADGKVMHEITKIQSDAQAPAGAFDLPSDYATSTPQEMMQKMMLEMKKKMDAMPPEQRQKMMEQMQQRRDQMSPPPGMSAPEGQQ